MDTSSPEMLILHLLPPFIFLANPKHGLFLLRANAVWARVNAILARANAVLARANAVGARANAVRAWAKEDQQRTKTGHARATF